MRVITLVPLDWAVMIVYLLAITAVGVLAGRSVKDTEHYFLGGRHFSKWIMIAQSFGTGTHSEMPVSLAGAVYTTGASAIWFQWKNLFATPFYWLLAPLFRRMRRTTTGEVVEDRYGAWLGVVYTIFALCFFTIGTAGMLKGAAKVISQAVGGNVPVNGLVVGMTVVFILYSFVGGLVASAWTDFVQGGLILVLSFLLIPLGFPGIGGMGGMRQVLAPHFFSLATPQGIGPWFILMLTINGLIGISAQPHIMGVAGTGKDEHACRIGFMYGNFTKRFCTVGWVMVGLIVAAMVARGTFGISALQDPEDAFGFACRQLLFPGGVGLLVACVLAANMAACSAFMVDSGALFTRNLYHRYLDRNATDKRCLLVGRLSGVAVTLLGVLYAVFLIRRVLYSFLLTETMATFVGISILGGIVWRRANRWGALASLVVSMGTNFALYSSRGQRLDHWDPNVFGIALAAGIVALIVGSLLTPPEPEAAMRVFFGNLETPSDSGAGLAQSAAAGSQLLVVHLLQLRRGAQGLPWRTAYRDDLVGFAKGWGVAAALVALAWLIFQA
jgi:Na+/proline symporter